MNIRGRVSSAIGVEIVTSLRSIVMSILKGNACFSLSLILQGSNKKNSSSTNLNLSTGSIVSIRSSTSILVCARKKGSCWYISKEYKYFVLC